VSTYQLSPQRLLAGSADFNAKLKNLVAWSAVADEELETSVRSILRDVQARGDAALCDYTEKFDGYRVSTINELIVGQDQMQRALQELPAELRQALEQSAQRISDFHQRQKSESWRYTDADGTLLGQQVTALDRVGLYVPGGKAAYPSSVLMNALPAVVAGVREIVMVSPAPGGELNSVVLAAAALAGVDRLVTVGGAQAIAALAYGTETLAPVDKIVGPGNRYVACAKKQVFGQVGLDMVAGPSEILIVCDGKTNPDWIAMDLFSQAEHDEDAQAILVSPDVAYFDAVEASMNRLIETMPRQAIIRESITRRAAFIQVADLGEAIEIVNAVAPEHLELSVDTPEQYLPAIRSAGAIFMGRYTPEAIGDYCAGPNHVLPTSTTARFASPLGVYDFQKRSSLIKCSPESAAKLSAIAATVAGAESLIAHQQSARMRIPD
jgi:histidinol dehydrogenase